MLKKIIALFFLLLCFFAIAQAEDIEIAPGDTKSVFVYYTTGDVYNYTFIEYDGTKYHSSTNNTFTVKESGTDILKVTMSSDTSLTVNDRHACQVTFEGINPGYVELQAKAMQAYYTTSEYPDYRPAETKTCRITVKKNAYTISYNGNSSDSYNMPSAQEQSIGSSITLSSVIPIRDGYNFLGWRYGNNYYQPGGSYSFTQDTTLYAMWEFDHYVIKYNANGGTGAPSTQSKNPGQTINLSRTIPQKQGYEFLGWTSSSTSNIVECNPGDAYSNDEFLTLYAVWKAIPITGIELDQDSLEVYKEQSARIIANVLPSNALQAVTWSSSDTSIATVSSFGTVTGVSEGTVQIRATTSNNTIFAECTVVVKTDPNKRVKIDSTNFPDSYFRSYLRDYDSDGNGYLGDDELFRINEIKTIGTSITSLKGIALLTNLRTVDISISKVSSLDLRGCKSIREVKAADGYIENTRYSYLQSLIADDCKTLERLSAWSCSKLKSVSVKGCSSLTNISTGNSDALSTIYLSGCISLSNLDLFDNICTSIDLSDCYELDLLDVSGNNTKLTSLNISHCPKLIDVYLNNDKYVNGTRVRYNYSGSYIILHSKTKITCNSTLEILMNPTAIEAMFNTNATFSIAAKGKGLSYQWETNEGNGYHELTDQNTNKLTVLAKKNGTYRCKVTDDSGEELYTNAATLTVIYQYTVSYDANGGSGAPTSQEKTQGVTLILSSVVPVLNGYTFNGWATTSTATSAAYQPGGSYNQDADVILYAVWKENVSNVCGDNLTWSVSGSGQLIISGYGDMYDFPPVKVNSEWISSAPWGDDIEQVLIQDGVTSIGRGAFYKCYGLIGITMPSSINSIGKTAFFMCSSLSYLTLPDQIEEIAPYAFRECTSLTEIYLPQELNTLGEGAFIDCTGLQEVYAYNCLTEIGADAFSNCPNLILNVEENSYAQSYALSNSINYRLLPGVQILVLPSYLTTIESGAFSGTAAQAIRIPSSVTSVAPDAIPKTVKIYAPKDSNIAQWFKNNGYTVVEETDLDGIDKYIDNNVQDTFKDFNA